MKSVMTYENLRSFAYVNDRLIVGEIRGIVINFYGLGNQTIHNSDPGDAYDYAKEGILYVVPYTNPWAWMNRQSVAYVDEILAVLCEKYALGDRVKVVSTGGSMGGLAAIVYCAYARITPIACVTNCPVCDLVYHYGERPDLPRTLYSAFGEYDGDMESALRTASPIHLVDRLPKIPYTIFHCEQDKMVNLEQHSVRFVQAMEKTHQIRLSTVPGRAHCDLSPQARLDYMKEILQALGR